MATDPKTSTDDTGLKACKNPNTACVKALLKLAQEYKALVIKAGDIEIHMSPVNFLPQTMTNVDQDVESVEDIKKRVEKILADEDESLFYST